MLDQLTKARSYKVSLNPGDVLFVPHQWWHQVVTTSEWSISVNTWVPTPGDNMARLKEALTRWQIANIVKNLRDETLKKYVLNPNEDDLIDTPIEEFSKIIEFTLKDANDSDSDKYNDFNNIEFTEKYERLESSSIVIPKSILIGARKRETLVEVWDLGHPFEHNIMESKRMTAPVIWSSDISHGNLMKCSTLLLNYPEAFIGKSIGCCDIVDINLNTPLRRIIHGSNPSFSNPNPIIGVKLTASHVLILDILK